MPTISETEAREILAPFHGRIRTVVERAWGECKDVAKFRIEAGHGPLLYRRTFSNEMFDSIARHAIAEFGSDENVYVRLEAQTLKIFFGSMLVARFKRGDQKKLGRNIQTQAVLDFIQPEGSVVGLLPEGGKVEFVWTSNDTQTAFEDVFVTARDGNRLVWHYGIAVAGGAEVVEWPTPTRTPPSDDTGDLVTPKLPSDKKKSDKE